MTRTRYLGAMLCLLAGPVAAVDADNGEQLYWDVAIERVIQGQAYTNANCETCHDAEFYLREERKVRSHAMLESYVDGCSTNLDVGWFPDEVADVAAWLNREYYRFESD